MADFCKACSVENWGKDFNDLAGLISEEECQQGYRIFALCEGCGPIYVDHLGQKWGSTEEGGKFDLLDERIQ